MSISFAAICAPKMETQPIFYFFESGGAANAGRFGCFFPVARAMRDQAKELPRGGEKAWGFGFFWEV